ncbi:hypothetical protein A9Q96_04025 [Rhodobacterales bacterium 52_120_T64]|mgnify:FL=1|nr:hypothetical protein A9Q96_04025 [Rhodobacterales bacterium 52_120_T64]
MNYSPNKVPARAGVGYKPQHLDEILAEPNSIGWLEIHAENYMGDGGPQLAQLRYLRERFPISCHGVGLSIGSEGPLDKEHLARLKKLVDWLNPSLFSEHLAWSTHDIGYLNDLLPAPYTPQTLSTVIDHIDQVQEVIGRQMLLENPSVYVLFEQSTMNEIEFLNEIVTRTGCGLLLDVNNIFVSTTNQQSSAEDYLADFPVEHIGEVHLGGHDAQTDDFGDPLLIDSHNAPVVDPVWDIYETLIKRTGPLPTLIEWDNDIPEWPVLANEARLADVILNRRTKAA